MGFMVILKNVMGFGSSALTFVQSHVTILAVASAVSLAGMGTSYIKGRTDGYDKCQGQVAQQDNQQYAAVLTTLEENRKIMERFALEQNISNQKLSQEIRTKIDNKEVIYKELQGEPIILQGPCDPNVPVLQYDSTLGVLERAADSTSNGDTRADGTNPSS